MSLQLLCLPMLVKYEIFGLLSLQEKIIISTVSARCQNLVKQVLSRQTFRFKIIDGQRHILKSSNSEIFEFIGNKKSSLEDVHLYDIHKKRIPIFMGTDYVEIMRRMLETLHKVLRSCAISVQYRNVTLTTDVLNNFWDSKTIHILSHCEIKKLEPSNPFECDSIVIETAISLSMKKFLSLFSNCKYARVYYRKFENVVTNVEILKKLRAVPVSSITFDETRYVYRDGDCYKISQQDGTEAIVRREPNFFQLSTNFQTMFS